MAAVESMAAADRTVVDVADVQVYSDIVGSHLDRTIEVLVSQHNQVAGMLEFAERIVVGFHLSYPEGTHSAYEPLILG